jgi:hypothetical protein
MLNCIYKCVHINNTLKEEYFIIIWQWNRNNMIYALLWKQYWNILICTTYITMNQINNTTEHFF